MVQLQLSRKRSNYRILVIFVLLLCPIASVPLIISGILNKRHELLPLLSFVMATLAILSPPFADLYRHALNFQYYKHSSVPISTIFMHKDYVLDLLEYYFAKWNFNFEFIRGLFVFVCYQIAFALYKELFKYVQVLSYSKKYRCIIFLSVFFLVPFIWIVNGLRSATSSYLFVYSWLSLYNGKRIKCWLFALLGVFTHFFGIVFIPVIILFHFRKYRISYFSYVIGAIVLFLLGKAIFSNLLDSISEDTLSSVGVTSQIRDYYVGTDEEGALTYSGLSFNGFIAMFMERSPLFYIFFTTIKSRCRNYDKDDLFMIRVLFLLWIFISSSWIPFQRISWLISPIVMFLFIKNMKFNEQHIRTRLLLLFTIIGQIAYIYGYRMVFFNTPFYLISLPLYFPVFHSYPGSFYIADDAPIRFLQ